MSEHIFETEIRLLEGNVFQVLKKVDDAVGLTTAQIKSRFEASLASMNYSKLLAGKDNPATATKSVELISSSFRKMAQEAGLSAKATEAAYGQLAKRIKYTFSDLGIDKQTRVAVNSALREIQAGFTKQAFNATVKINLDTTSAKNQARQIQNDLKAAYTTSKNDYAAGRITRPEYIKQLQDQLGLAPNTRGDDQIRAQIARQQGMQKRENAAYWAQQDRINAQERRREDAITRRIMEESKRAQRSSNGSSSPNTLTSGSQVGYDRGGQIQAALSTLAFSQLASAANDLSRTMVKAAASMELYERRINTVIKNPGQAKSYFEFLKSYEKDTAYELPEVLQAGVAFAAQGRQLGKVGLGKERAIKLAGELGSLNPSAGIEEGQRVISKVAAGDPNALRILHSQFAISNEVLREGGARVTDKGVSLQSLANRKAVIHAIDKYIEETTGGRGARDQATTLSGRFSTLSSQAFVSAAAVMEPLVPVLKDILTSLTNFFVGIANWPPTLKSIVSTSVLAVSAFTTFASVTSGVILVVNALANAVKALGIASAASSFMNAGKANRAALVGQAFLGNTAAAGALESGAGASAFLGGTSAAFLGGAAAFTIAAVAVELYAEKVVMNQARDKAAKAALESLGQSGNRGKYELETTQAAFMSNVEFAQRYGSKEDVDKVREEAKRRKRKAQVISDQEQVVFDYLYKNKDISDPERIKAEKSLETLKVMIETLGSVAEGTSIDLKGLAEEVGLLQAQSELGNNDPNSLASNIQGLGKYQDLLKAQQRGEPLSNEQLQALYGYQKQIRDLRDQGDANTVETDLAQKGLGYADRGGANQQERIADLAQKAEAIKRRTASETINYLKAEAAMREEMHKRDREYNTRSIEYVRIRQGEYAAKVQEINRKEQDSLRELGQVTSVEEQKKLGAKLNTLRASLSNLSDEKKAAVQNQIDIGQKQLDTVKQTYAQQHKIMAQANAERIAAHVDMLTKIRDAEKANADIISDILKSKTGRDQSKAELEKTKLQANEDKMSDQEKLKNYDKVKAKEDEILSIKKKSTEQSIKDIDRDTENQIQKIKGDLNVPGRLTGKEREAAEASIPLLRQKAEEAKQKARQDYNEEFDRAKIGQATDKFNREKGSNLETFDQKLKVLEQGKLELEYASAYRKKNGQETEFSKQDDLQKQFEIEKQILQVQAERASAELPAIGAEVEKANIAKKLRLDILNLQQQYVDKLKEGGDEMDRQNRILELQKKLKDQPATYGIEDLNQRMKDESELFRLQAGFGDPGAKLGKGKGPYPGYGPKPYNGVDKRPGTFIFGDLTPPTDLTQKTANQVFGEAGELTKNSRGQTIKRIPGPTGFSPNGVPDLVINVPVSLNGEKVAEGTKKYKLSDFDAKNRDIKQGGKPRGT